MEKSHDNDDECATSSEHVCTCRQDQPFMLVTELGLIEKS